MISTVERVLFLKGIDLFSAVSSEMLVAVAKLAEEVRFGENEELMREGVRRGRIRVDDVSPQTSIKTPELRRRAETPVAPRFDL